MPLLRCSTLHRQILLELAMEPRKLRSEEEKTQSECKPCYDQRCDVGKQSSVPCVYRGRTRVNLDGLSDQIRAARMKNQAGRLPALLPAIADGGLQRRK